MSRIAIPEGQCYWCRQREANSREHKFKRSDLVREHGRGELRGERTIVKYGAEGSLDIRSTKSAALKFRPSLCAECNNARSQPIDAAYDRFVDGVLDNEKKILAERKIDLEEIFGAEWQPAAADTHRYYVKHALCRLVESHRDPGEVELPADALAFLDGGQPPQSFTSEFWIEPTWLRFWEKGEGDPLWVRPMGMESLYGGPNGRIGGRLNYGWLVLGWEFWGEGSGHPFDDELTPTPIIATKAVDLELALMPTTAQPPDGEDFEPDREWLERVVGDNRPIAPDRSLSQSPVGQAFVGGALDFEAGTRDLAPDRREPMEEDPVAEHGLELRRVGLLAAIARDVWARGEIDVAGVRAVEPSPRQLDGDVLRTAVAPFEELDPQGGWETVRAGLAAMSSLKLVEAMDLGTTTEGGDQALLDAARLAGCCVAALGPAGSDWPVVWDSVSAAIARIVRIL
jgi:hypothetical protein